MAEKFTKLTHVNGATVQVTSDKAERLLAGNGWATEKKTAAKQADDKK